MASVFPGAPYRSRGTSLTDTSETTVSATVEAQRWHTVTNLRAATASGLASTLTIKFCPSVGGPFVLVSNAVIPANDALNIEFMPLALNSGDELHVIGASGTDVVVTYLDHGRANN